MVFGVGVLLAGTDDFAAPGELALTVPQPARPIRPAMATSTVRRISADMMLTFFRQALCFFIDLRAVPGG